MKNANYRKHNNHSQNSSTYHKKYGTNIRALLKRDADEEAADSLACCHLMCDFPATSLIDGKGYCRYHAQPGGYWFDA